MKRTSITTYIRAYGPAIVWAAIIFILSSQKVLPGIEVDALDFVAKKTAHITVYAILYLLFFRAINQTTKNNKYIKLLLIPITLCLLYAISDEIHQSFTPARHPTIRDIGYDMLGVWIAFLKKYNYL